MREAVLDSSVVLKWFTSGEEHEDRARALRAAFEEGELRVIAPPLLLLELLNAAARGWRWTGEQLAELAEGLGKLRFAFVDPSLPDVARWAALGLSAYDAAFVAVAESAGVELVTADQRIASLAPDVARPLAGVA